MTNKTILIVDDSELDRALLAGALAKKTGFDTPEAASAAECLEILKHRKVDLILMDIVMPGTLGSQVLQTIRETSNPISLPIIMVTSKSDAVDIIHCLQSGANDYITKPVNFEVAVSRIVTHLTLAEVSHEMGRLRELEALNAMIATYNHEINNPLAIAFGCIDPDMPGTPEVKREKLKASLTRIKEIVRKIREVTEHKDHPEYEDYTGRAKMLKVR